MDIDHAVRRAGPRRRASRAPRSGTVAAILLAALVVAGLALRAVGALGAAPVENFFLVLGSLLIEAFPFVVLGALVSAFIEVFVPARVFARVARLPAAVQMPAAGLGGFAFPVCECGSVPVARRLVSKGLRPSAAITFMLAAPILNPVVLVATAIAYRGRDVMWAMVLGRAALGLAAAMAVGWVVGRRTADQILRSPGGDDHGHGADPSVGRWSAFFTQMADDLVMLGGYLVVGGAVAAALQTFLPQSVLGSLAETPILNLLALMGLAAVLSLCSESDAFVAASFVQFGPAAQLAFLVFGPMIDAKLVLLYSGVFGAGFVRTAVVVAGVVTLVGTLWLQLLIG
jgi:uncharacterized membrane protein YraQ (UPF0718 family)